MSLAPHCPESWLCLETAIEASGSLSAATNIIECAGAKLPQVAEPSGEAYAQAVTTLLPYLLSHRSRLAAFTASQAALTNTTTSTTASQAAATTTSQPATASTTGRGKGGVPDSAHATSEFEQVLGGGTSTTHGGGKGQEEEVPGSPVRSRPQEFLAGLQPDQRHQLAVLVDTAILKVPLRLATQYSCCNQGHCFLLHCPDHHSRVLLLLSLSTLHCATGLHRYCVFHC